MFQDSQAEMLREEILIIQIVLEINLEGILAYLLG